MVEKYNPSRCAERIPPDSTFKVALSLMAFDSNIITQKTIFKWDGKQRWLPAWNQDQTPHTWLKNSVVWVSQEITPQLGLPKIKAYLKAFNYGNQDFSGDPGKNNGLTNAWLVSSLKISGDEQLTFLKAFLSDKLPVSKEAVNNTKENMFLEDLPQDWKLYGKSGSGPRTQAVDDGLTTGWFIGFVQKNNQTYIFVTNFTDLQITENSAQSGTTAKEITKDILKDTGIF